MNTVSRTKAVAKQESRRAESGPLWLGQEDFIPLSVRGFGDGWNSYAQAMAWFNGRLYCGTARAGYCLAYLRKIGRPRFRPWPIKCPNADIAKTLDLRAQIWRFDPTAAEWQQAYVSPLAKGRDGQDFPREISYRFMTVLQTPADSRPTLYVNTYGSATRGINAVILRCEDGETFAPVSKPGLGLEGVISYRTLKMFKGKIYTTPVGATAGQVNVSSFPAVFECDDLSAQQWRAVSEPGFGDPNNFVVFEMEVFNGHLYAGTANHVSGFQLWKTDAEGPPPYRWKRVLHLGAYRGNYNEGVAAMCVFNGALYITACIQDGGYDQVNGIGPGAPELLRVNADDSWDIVVGTPRLTPEGVKMPTSGFNPGFDDFTNGYLWRMCEHRGRLYVSSFNWAANLPFVDRSKMATPVRRLLEEVGIDELVEKHAGFDLWSTADGDNFSPVTVNGFGNPFNFGARTLVSTPIGLAVGAANSFGPEIATMQGDTVAYVPNPRGGTEVWLGSADFSDQLLNMRTCGTSDGQPARAELWRLPPVGDAVEQRKYLVASEPGDVRRFEFDEAALRRYAAGIDQAPLIADHVIEAHGLFDLKVDGIEHVPADGPVLLLGNNPAAPLMIDGLPVSAHSIYTLDAVLSRRRRPVWLLAVARYFELAERSKYVAEMLARMGFIPATLDNGTRLLQMGEAVIGYPEERASRPPYGLHPFAPTYVRMALDAGAPIVPVVFLGTHESHLLIEHEDRQILVNKTQRFRTNFQVTFLPPVDVRLELGANARPKAIEAFSEGMRLRMQACINEQKKLRPLVNVVEQLQQRRLHIRRAGDPDLGDISDILGDL